MQSHPKIGDKLLCIKSRDIFKKGKYYTVYAFDEKDKTIKMNSKSRWSGEWFWLNDSPIRDMEIDTEMFPSLKEYFANEIDVRRLKLEEIGKNESGR